MSVLVFTLVVLDLVLVGLRASGDRSSSSLVSILVLCLAGIVYLERNWII